MKNTFATLRTVTMALMALVGLGMAAGGTKTVTLTGTLYEPVLATIGSNGRTEVISSLPYRFEMPKEQFPFTIKFQSENFLYFNIDVPKKPFDSAGHTYLVKVNETAMNLNANRAQMAAASASKAIMAPAMVEGGVKGIDVTHGVNAAPITGMKNDNLVALIITNEEYESASKVSHATNDGLAFKEYCLKTLGVQQHHIKYGANLSYGKMKKTIKDALDITENLGGQGSLLVFYAGHGIPDNDTKDAYIMPIDADGTDTDVCFSLAELYRQFEQRNIDRTVVFLDACFSGAQRDGDMIVAARGVALKPREVQVNGRTIVFTATSDKEAAYGYNDEQHGMFTYFLLKKLQESKGKVKLGELADYLRDKVGTQSLISNSVRQTPSVIVSPNLQEEWSSMRLHK